jgi:hypothetical protein
MIKNNVYFILGIMAALFVVYILYIVKRAVISARIKKGLKAEKDAENFLKSRGYKIEAYQPEFEYIFRADGEEIIVKLRPDYIVKKGGKRYIAEVKCGEYASSLHSRDTRRQLMEYYFNIDFDGLFLVDMRDKKIIEIEFESRAKREKAVKLNFLKAILLISIIINIILAIVIKSK